MKTLIRSAVLIVAMLLVSGSAAAQQEWKFDFSSLAQKANETVEVKLDGKMLELAAKFLSSEDAEEAEVREIVQGLQGIYIYSFTFDKDWEYDKSVAEAVRRQIGPGWEKMITVRSRTKENVDIWVRPGATVLDGIFIVAAEPREFTVVNIVGSIDIDKLSRLEGQFGIPELDVETTKSVEKRINR